MPITFENLQPNTLVPFFYAEVTTRAQPISPALRLMMIGYKNRGVEFDEGEAEDNVPYLLSDSIVRTLFGAGSMLENMYWSIRANAPQAEVWGIGVEGDDDFLRSYAHMQVVADPSINRSGYMNFYVAGQGVSVRVDFDHSRATVRNRIFNEVNAKASLPVKAVKRHPVTNVLGAENELWLVCKWAGNTGNDINVSARSPRGHVDQLVRRMLQFDGHLAGGDGETGPAGALARLGDMEVDIFVIPEVGLAALGSFREFMNHVAGRWSPSKQLYGHVVMARKNDFTTLTDFAMELNDPHLSILGYVGTVQPSWEWAGALAGVMSRSWVAPPNLSRPLQTLELVGLFASWSDDLIFTTQERQELLARGISTYTVSNDGTVRIERVRTLRKYSDAGEQDPSWADAITMFQAQYLVRFLRRAITAAFPRSALSTEPMNIDGFASPEEIRQVILAAYDDMVEVGLVENAGLFEEALIVERHATDRNRVDCYLRPDFVNQLRVVAAVVETNLELIEEGQIAA